MTETLRRLAALVVCASLIGGCGYATRKGQSETLVNAAKRLERVKTARGSLAISVTAPTRTEGLATLPFQGSVSIPPLAVEFAFADRAAASAEAIGARGAVPAAVFQRAVVFMKRPVRAADLESQFGFRAWSRLDFSKLKRKDKNTLGTVNIVNPINPAYLMRLLAGTLSGSVRRLGVANVGDATTTHFRMNVDRSKAFSRIGDKDRQAIDKAFSSNNIKGSIVKNAEAWIDSQGLPRRVRLTFKQKFTIRAARELAVDIVVPITYTFELGQFGAPVHIAAPDRNAVAEVGTLNALLEGTQL